MSELIKLKKRLGRNHIYFKPAQLYADKSTNVYASILAYKDARVDMEVLDEVVGPGNWQNKYERDSKGILQCGIGIYINDQWIWKWSNGVPSDFEGEKGEYSDSFKRAGFMWGIGRDLYDFPNIRVVMNEKEYYMKDGKPRATGYFRPNEWEWDISDDYSKVVARQKIGGKLVVRFDSNPYNKGIEKVDYKAKIESCNTVDELIKLWGTIPEKEKSKQVTDLFTKRKLEL